MGKILVVDDEQDICEILQFNLETEGYEVDVAYSAEEAMRLPLAEYDLLLLDVMMGEMSGFQFARFLKQEPKTSDLPIIFITALDDENNVVKGLNIGADDYMSKPLSMREVKARVQAVLRRSNKLKNTVEEVEDFDDECIDFESLKINLVTKRVYVDNKEVQFTRLEFELLALLVQNAGKVFSREMILDKIWPGDAVVMDRTVDVNITRIRKKIGDYGKYIKTRFGYGYTFDS
ncbi:MAG: response regulator transcription factor [Bacteroidaceae bacterium]|nr:response regulator transcription factor [Bacteroidaceae bacterium]